MNPLAHIAAMQWYQPAVAATQIAFIVYVATINLLYLFLTLLGYFGLRREYLRLNRQQRTLLSVSPLLFHANPPSILH